MKMIPIPYRRFLGQNDVKGLEAERLEQKLDIPLHWGHPPPQILENQGVQRNHFKHLDK